VDVPIGAVVLIFAHVMVGTIWVSVAQTVMASQLLKALKESLPDLDTREG